MTRIMLFGVLTLGGCTYQLREPVAADNINVYSKAEVDAINARNECLQLARTTLQALRCDPHGR